MADVKSRMDGAPDVSPLHRPLTFTEQPPAVLDAASAAHATTHPLKRTMQAGADRPGPQRHCATKKPRPDAAAGDAGLSGDIQSAGAHETKSERGGKQEAGVERKVCEMCGASFTKKFYLDRHLKTHTGWFADTVTLGYYYDVS